MSCLFEVRELKAKGNIQCYNLKKHTIFVKYAFNKIIFMIQSMKSQVKKTYFMYTNCRP